jgi:hypothetical protein
MQINGKPAHLDRDWLYGKYVDERLSAAQIGRLVNRAVKSVYETLIRYGIPTRSNRDPDSKALIPCGCGCGTLIVKRNAKGRARRFAPFHATRALVAAGWRPARTVRPLADRFWEKVDNDGPVPEHRPELGPCWLWTGARHVRSGHARINLGGGKGATHAARVSWELHNGPLGPGQQACHHCDNPACVRPTHLFAGTQSDNVRDMHAKGRASGRQARPPSPR